MDIQDHMASPHVSLEQYTKRRQVQLGESLDGLLALYLDQNFWIRLRKSEFGQGNKDEQELLSVIRGAAKDGRIFCPISESVFMELMKQSDISSRLRTAKLIDELSFGIALIAPDVRIATELARFVYYRGPKASSLHPLRHLVWTKLPWVLGIHHPVSAAFDQAMMLAVQKSFFDKMWSVSMSDMIATIGDTAWPPSDDFDRLAVNLNDSNRQHASEIKTFKDAYRAEALGVVDFVMDDMMKTVSDIAARESGSFFSKDSPEWFAQREQWRSLLFVALQEDEGCRQLPSLHVLARLHAAFRWNKARQFEANDFFDFHHAAAAVGYCQAFFTERSMRAMITENNVALDSFHGCHVESSVPAAISYLRNVLPGGD